MALTTHPHPAPRLKKEHRYTSSPPLCIPGRLLGEIHLLRKISSSLLSVSTLCQTSYQGYTLFSSYLSSSLTDSISQLTCDTLEILTFIRTSQVGVGPTQGPNLQRKTTKHTLTQRAEFKPTLPVFEHSKKQRFISRDHSYAHANKQNTSHTKLKYTKATVTLTAL